MDPMAGGGSIPLEALRHGLTTLAYELNPVAPVILQATLCYPARFGNNFVEKIEELDHHLHPLTYHFPEGV